MLVKKLKTAELKNVTRVEMHIGYSCIHKIDISKGSPLLL